MLCRRPEHPPSPRGSGRPRPTLPPRVGTGARHAYFNHPEWEPFAPGLKTLEDALEIRRRILLAFERAEREVDDVARQRELLTFVQQRWERQFGLIEVG